MNFDQLGCDAIITTGRNVTLNNTSTSHRSGNHDLMYAFIIDKYIYAELNVKCYLDIDFEYYLYMILKMKDVKYKAVTFVTNGNIAKGHYFYDITLSEAVNKMKEKGIDPTSILNIKMNISCYPY